MFQQPQYKPVPTSEAKDVTKDPLTTRGFTGGISPGFWLNLVVMVFAVFFTFLFGEMELNLEFALGPNNLMWINLVILVLVAIFCVLVTFQVKAGGPSIVGYPTLRVYEAEQIFRPWGPLFFMLLVYAYLVVKQVALYIHYSGYIDQFDQFEVDNTPIQYESMHRVFADAQHGFNTALAFFVTCVCVLFFYERNPTLSKAMKQVELLSKSKLSPQQFAANMEALQ